MQIITFQYYCTFTFVFITAKHINKATTINMLPIRWIHPCRSEKHYLRMSKSIKNIVVILMIFMFNWTFLF